MQTEVLLIEPDKLLASTYTQALGADKINTVWQASAQDAISAIEMFKPKLIILEVQLPGHNGVEFLNELRSYADWQNIPVILLTYVPESEIGLNKHQKKLLGIHEYCYKPQTSLKKLVDVTQETLNTFVTIYD